MKTSPITALRRLLYGAAIVGISGLSLTTKTQAQTTECDTATQIRYVDTTIVFCQGAKVSYPVNHEIFWTPARNAAGWGLLAIQNMNNQSDIPIFTGGDNKKFNDLSIEPNTTRSFKFTFIHSSGTTCYIQRDVEVVSPPTITLIDDQREGCEGVMTKVYPTAKGDYEKIVWTAPKSDETNIPFTLPSVGEHTIKAKVSKDGCPGQTREASLTYKVTGKPNFEIVEESTPNYTYNFPEFSVCKTCNNTTLTTDVTAIRLTVKEGAQFMPTEPIVVQNAKIVWGNSPNPASSLNAATTFKGTYTAKAISTNLCGSNTVDVSFIVQQPVNVKTCEPSLLPSPPPCDGGEYIAVVAMTEGQITEDPAVTITGYTPTIGPNKSNRRREFIFSPAVQGKQNSYTIKVKYQIACPSVTAPLQGSNLEKTLSGQVKVNTGANCDLFTSTYEYCVGGKAVYTITAKDIKTEITKIDLDAGHASLFTETKPAPGKHVRQFTSKAVIADAATKAQHEPLVATLEYTIGGSGNKPSYVDNISLTQRTDCSPTMSITYRPYLIDNAGTYKAEMACAGDTILLTLSSGSSAYKLVGLDVPFGAHHSGDKTPFRTETAADGSTTLTYRFYSYHCYLKSDGGGGSAIDSVLPFKMRYRFGEQDETTTLYEHIKVRTCPPKTGLIWGAEASGFASPCPTKILATNRSTNSTHLKVLNWNLKQNSFVSLDGYEQPPKSNSQEEGMWQVNYKIYNFVNDTTFNIFFQFNEGDTIRTMTLKNQGSDNDNRTRFFYRTKKTPTVTPSKSPACAGDNLDFTVDLSSIDRKPNTRKCENLALTWKTPATDLKKTGTESDAQGEAKHKYHTDNARPGTYKDYKWTLTFRHKDLGIDMSLDLYPPKDFVVFGANVVFKEDTIRVCEGMKTWLIEYIQDSFQASISKFFLNNVEYEKKIPTGSNPNNQNFLAALDQGSDVNPGRLIAVINTPTCDESTYDEEVPFIVETSIDGNLLPQVVDEGIPPCKGNTVKVRAQTNSLITWVKGTDTLCRKCPANQDIDLLLDANEVVVIAMQYNSCSNTPVVAPIKLWPLAYPNAAITTDTGACPYTPFNFKGVIDNSGVTNATIEKNYTLFNLRTGREISTSKLSPDGLQQYEFLPQDSLLLCFNTETRPDPDPGASVVGCRRSDSARLVAYPSPKLQLTAGGTEQTKGANYCLPLGTKKLTLRASGADDFTWLTVTRSTNRKLDLEDLSQDSLVRVRGVENRHGCADTFALKCVIAVGQKSPMAAICPNDPVGVCFEADNLPGTTYKWEAVGSNLTDVSAVNGFKACNITKSGTYKLTATRTGNICPMVYNYTLSYHATPVLSTDRGLLPLCKGNKLPIQFNLNSNGDFELDPDQTYFTRHDGSKLAPTKYDGGQSKPTHIYYEKNGVDLSDTGTYRLHVKTLKSCEAEAVIQIRVDTALPVKILFSEEKTDKFCEGEVSNLKAEIKQIAGRNYIYHWYIKTPSGEEPMPNASENKLAVKWPFSLNNQYVYIRVKQDACISSDSIKAAVIKLPVLSLSQTKDTGICDGYPFALIPLSDVDNPQSVTWYFIGEDGEMVKLRKENNGLTPYRLDTVRDDNAGRYFFTASNEDCLAYSDTARLKVHPLPKVSITGPAFICSGSTTTLQAKENNKLEGRFLWKHSNDTTAQVVINKEGVYWVTYTTVHGCSNKDSISIEGRETPYFRLPNDTAICRGTSFVLVGPSGLDSVMWQDGLTDNKREIDKDGWYILTGYKNECSSTDSILIKMTFCGQFHIPSAFSPNGNQVNDLWGAISSAKDDDMSEFDLMVFDRDGRVVFHGKKISDRWDGRYKGKMCPPGVYPYMFRAVEKFEGIRYQASHTVTIVL